MYLGKFGEKLKFVELNERDKVGDPDVFCTLHGQAIGVEIGHIHDSQLAAMIALGREPRNLTRAEKLRNAMIPLDRKIPGSINRELRRKANMRYATKRTWLVLRIARPLWSKEEIEANRDKIVIPANHQFEKIWLLCGVQVEFGMIQLY